MNSNDAFTRAALYATCRRSKILSNIDLENADIQTLRYFVNKLNDITLQELPILLTKMTVKYGVSFICEKIPHFQKYMSSDNLSIQLEDDELSYLLRSESKIKPNIYMIVLRNIIVSVLGVSIENLRDSIFKSHSQAAAAAAEDSVSQAKSFIKTKSMEVPMNLGASVRREFTDNFNPERFVGNKNNVKNDETRVDKSSIESDEPPPPPTLDYREMIMMDAEEENISESANVRPGSANMSESLNAHQLESLNDASQSHTRSESINGEVVVAAAAETRQHTSFIEPSPPETRQHTSFIEPPSPPMSERVHDDESVNNSENDELDDDDDDNDEKSNDEDGSVGSSHEAEITPLQDLDELSCSYKSIDPKRFIDIVDARRRLKRRGSDIPHVIPPMMTKRSRRRETPSPPPPPMIIDNEDDVVLSDDDDCFI